MPVIQLNRHPNKRVKKSKRTGRVYAIAFDLNTSVADELLGDYKKAYGRIQTVLNSFGFMRQQGSVYFGTEDSSSVDCFLAVQELDRRYPWFGRCVRDLRMLRVEEENDLMPALSDELRLDSGAAATG